VNNNVLISALSGVTGALVGGVAALCGVYVQDKLSTKRKKLLTRELLEGELQAVRYLLLEARWYWAYSWMKHNYYEKKKNILTSRKNTESRLDDVYDQLKFWRAKELAKGERLDEVLSKLHPLLVRIRLNFKNNKDIVKQCNKLSELDLSRYFIDFPDDGIKSLSQLEAWVSKVESSLEETNHIWQKELNILLKFVSEANKGV